MFLFSSTNISGAEAKAAAIIWLVIPIGSTENAVEDDPVIITEETTSSAYELLNIAKKLNEAVNKFKV